MATLECHKSTIGLRYHCWSEYQLTCDVLGSRSSDSRCPDVRKASKRDEWATKCKVCQLNNNYGHVPGHTPTLYSVMTT